MSRKNSIANCDSFGEQEMKTEDCVVPAIFSAESFEYQQERRMSTTSTKSSADMKTSLQSLRDAADELGNDTRKLYKFVKRRLSSKKKKRETEVKAIHIVPEADEEVKWANRSTSAHSATSSGTHSSVEREEEEDGIQTVHDMDNEYNVFHGC